MDVRLAVAAVLACLAFAAQAASEGVKAVYHMNGGVEQAPLFLRNIRNHLSVDPKAKIVVVTHGAGINFLKRGAKDRNGNPFEVGVQTLVSEGVEFRVCEITLKADKVDRKQLIDDVMFVPSGVAEIARLQVQEGFAYLKP